MEEKSTGPEENLSPEAIESKSDRKVWPYLLLFVIVVVISLFGALKGDVVKLVSSSSKSAGRYNMYRVVVPNDKEIGTYKSNSRRLSKYFNKKWANQKSGTKKYSPKLFSKEKKRKKKKTTAC